MSNSGRAEGGQGPSVIQLMVMGAVVLGLQDFVTRLIAATQRGEKLDDGTLSRLCAECVFAMKNSETAGFRMEDDAKIIDSAAKAVDHFIKSAILAGRKDAER